MKASTFIKNVSKYSVPTICSALVALIALPMISRVYPADNYAKISMFYDLGVVLMSLALFGMDSAYIRFRNDRRFLMSIYQMFYLSLTVGFTTIIGLFAVAMIFAPEQLARLIFDAQPDILILLAIYALFLVSFRMLSTESRMTGNVKRYNIQQVSYILINRFLFTIPALFTVNYWYACLFMTIGMAVLVTMSLKGGPKKTCCDASKVPEVVKRMLSFGLPTMPITVMLSLMAASDKAIIGNTLDFSQAGIFAIAISVANVFSFLPNAFCTYWSVFVYENYRDEQPFIVKVHDWIMIVSIVIVLIIILGQNLIFGILGSAYRESQGFFMLIMLWPIQGLISETTSYGINLACKTIYTLYIALATLAVNIALCFLLVPSFGLFGASIAYASAAILAFTAKTIIGQRFYRSIGSWIRTLGGFVLISFSCLANCIAFRSWPVRTLLVCSVVMIALCIYRKQLRALANMMRKNSSNSYRS